MLLLELEPSPDELPDDDDVPRPEVLDVVEVSPLLPQPDDEAAPKRVLFSASASHSVSPALAPVGLLGSLTIQFEDA